MKSGIVIINKESNLTSQNVVSRVKRILNVKKAGHTGTLDPLATGVLPVLIGDATKLSKYLIEHDKTYLATVKLGVQKDTGDDEGEIIQECNVPDLEEDFIIQVLQSLKGKQKQAPHKFSAVKINGKKLYEYARNNEKIEIPKRDIELYDLKLKNFDKTENEITFEVSCSKGTYIRVLCETIAEKLETVGFMKCLQRTKVDCFDIKNAVTLNQLTEENVISMEEVCNNCSFEKIELNNRKLELFLNGVMLTIHKNDGVYMIYRDKKFVGLGVVKDELLKRDVIINEF